MKNNKKSTYLKIGLVALILVSLVGAAYYMYVQDAQDVSNTYDISLDTSTVAAEEVSPEDLESATELDTTGDESLLVFTMNDGTIIRLTSSDLNPETQGLLYLSDKQYDSDVKIYVNNKIVETMPYLGIYNIGSVSVDITYKGTMVYSSVVQIIAGQATQVYPIYSKEIIEQSAAASKTIVTDTTTNTDTTSDIYNVAITVSPSSGSSIYYNGAYKGEGSATVVMSKGEIASVTVINSLYEGDITKAVRYDAKTLNIDLDSYLTKKSEDKIVEDGSTAEAIAEYVDESDDVFSGIEEGSTTVDITFTANAPFTLSYYDNINQVATSKIGTSSKSTSGKYYVYTGKFPYSTNTLYMVAQANGYKDVSIPVTLNRGLSRNLVMEQISTGVDTTGYYDVTFVFKGLVSGTSGTEWKPEGGQVTITSPKKFYVMQNNKYVETYATTINVGRSGQTTSGMVKFSPSQMISMKFTNMGVAEPVKMMTISTDQRPSTQLVKVTPSKLYITTAVNLNTLSSGGKLYVKPKISAVYGDITSDVGSVIGNSLATVTKISGLYDTKILVQTDSTGVITAGTYNAGKDSSLVTSDALDGTLKDYVYTEQVFSYTKIPVKMKSNLVSENIYMVTQYGQKGLTAAETAGVTYEIAAYQITTVNGKPEIKEILRPISFNPSNHVGKTPKEIAASLM